MVVGAGDQGHGYSVSHVAVPRDDLIEQVWRDEKPVGWTVLERCRCLTVGDELSLLFSGGCLILDKLLGGGPSLVLSLWSIMLLVVLRYP